MMTKHYALAVGLLAFEAGCPLLNVEAEVQEVCLTYRGIEVDGAIAGTSIEQSFVLDDLSALHDLSEIDAGLQFVRGEVRVTSGVESLAFVQSFKTSVASGDADSTLPTLTLFDCEGDCQAEGSKLSVPATVQQDAMEYVKSDSLVIELAFRGEIPATTFTLEADVCLKGRIAYTLDP